MDSDVPITRREIVTNGGSLLAGAFVGLFINPFQRLVNSALPDSLSRRASLQFGHSVFEPEPGNRIHSMKILNGGDEVAENVAIQIGFPEKITDYRVLQTGASSPPYPDFDATVNDDGSVSIRIDSLPPYRSLEAFTDLNLGFSVDWQSATNFEISRDTVFEDVLITYRYSWTFLDERYYANSDHHFEVISA